jgi:predicted RNase H-like nuclease (RuvC/YqgF family)
MATAAASSTAAAAAVSDDDDDQDGQPQQPSSPLEDAQCVRVTLQRSLLPANSSTTPHHDFDTLMENVHALVRALWLKEREIIEQLASAEERFRAVEAEAKRGARAVRRRERRVTRLTRELETKKASLDTYRRILSVPPVNPRKPQTVFEGSEEMDEEDEGADEEEEEEM